MAVNLTHGAIARICSNESVYSPDREFKPILQVIKVKNRCVWLSDGTNSNLGMLVSKLFNLVFSTLLHEGSVVKLTNYTLSKSLHRIIFILDLDVAPDKYHLIGQPLPLPKNASSLQPNVSDLQFSNLRLSDERKYLTQNAIEIICSGVVSDSLSCDNDFKPVLQVLDAKKNYICLSDGNHAIYAVPPSNLAEELRYYNVEILSSGLEQELVLSPRLNSFSIVKLTNYMLKNFDGHKFIIIFDYDVVPDTCDLIGSPVLLPETNVPMSINAIQKFSSTWTPVNLTQGAIEIMFSDEYSCDKGFRPVLQILFMSINSLLLSDGLYANTVNLPKNLTELVRTRRLQTWSVIKVTHFYVSVIQNRRTITIVDLDVILDDCGLIGRPVKPPNNVPEINVIRAGYR
ncbi:uncharacterized protein LOC131659223 [Vicia villosa]|uniref:uncharacterized protein LOC131659223 n=1 Tax=Vicia villosa TaxID=3911 RepID=UPI00273C4B3E|nr:uncharacterized protein LOC131659223 [Vicia villosa]